MDDEYRTAQRRAGMPDSFLTSHKNAEESFTIHLRDVSSIEFCNFTTLGGANRRDIRFYLSGQVLRITMNRDSAYEESILKRWKEVREFYG